VLDDLCLVSIQREKSASGFDRKKEGLAAGDRHLYPAIRLRCLVLYNDAGYLFLEVAMNSSVKSNVQIYYDLGQHSMKSTRINCR